MEPFFLRIGHSVKVTCLIAPAPYRGCAIVQAIEVRFLVLELMFSYEVTTRNRA